LLRFFKRNFVYSTNVAKSDHYGYFSQIPKSGKRPTENKPMPGSSSSFPSLGCFQTKFPQPPAPVARTTSSGAGPSSAPLREQQTLPRAPALPSVAVIAPTPRRSINPVKWAQEFCPTEQLHGLLNGASVSSTATLHKGLLVGGSTLLTFGVTFNTGVAAVDAVHQWCRGQTPSMGLLSNAAPRDLDAWDLVAGLAGYLGGAALSGPGNKAFQKVLAPLINLISTQIKSRAPEFMLNDNNYQLMNRIEPGWGDEVLQNVANLHSKQKLNSQQTKRLGQAAFALITLIRYIAQGKTVLGFTGIVAAGSAVSALSGFLIGAGMALNALTLAVKDIPRSKCRGGNLLEVANAGRSRADVKTRKVRVFEAEHQSVAQRWKTTFGSPQLHAEHPPLTLMQRAQAFHDSMGLVRSQYMARGVAAIGVAYAVKPFIAKEIENRWASGVVSGAILSLALYIAVPLWFDYVAKDIPETEKARRNARNGNTAATSTADQGSGSSSMTAPGTQTTAAASPPHVELDMSSVDLYALPTAAVSDTDSMDMPISQVTPPRF
jgi:hypothetical protein